MQKRRIALAVLAFVLVLSAAIGPAMAYFTTYTQARGGFTVNLQTTTEIKERVDMWDKYVSIQNTKGQQVMVRVKAYAGSQYTLEYSGEGWAPGADGWDEYAVPVEAGQSTPELHVHIGNIPEAEAESEIGVAVVYECAPVQYDGNGKAYAAWEKKLEGGTVA